jgi:hypothetical protein
MSQVVRDSNGRFVTGNAGGPGRKPREIEIEYLNTMESIVSGEAWTAICNRAVLDATNGDAKARTWLSAYLLGQPISRVEAQEENGLSKILRQLDREQDED